MAKIQRGCAYSDPMGQLNIGAPLFPALCRPLLCRAVNNRYRRAPGIAAFVIAAFLSAFAISDGHADSPSLRSQDLLVPVRELVADENTCGASALGSVVVNVTDLSLVVIVLGNGVPLRFLFDTGAQRSTITEAVAQRIGARTPRIEFQRGLRSIAGTMPSREVELDSFAVGNIQIPWPRLTVAPIATPRPGSTAVDGILGSDILNRFDIDLDLVRHQIGFYPSRACASAKPKWATAEIVVGRSAYGDHIFFPVQLDGHKVAALLDTGAQRTILSTAVARSLGVTEASPQIGPRFRTKGAAGEALASYVHRFTRLEIGPILVRNPVVVVADLQLRDGDLVLGMDFIGARHLWLSAASFRIFLSDPQP